MWLSTPETNNSWLESRMGNSEKRDLLKTNITSLDFLNAELQNELVNLGPLDFQKTDDVLGRIEQEFDSYIKVLANVDTTTTETAPIISDSPSWDSYDTVLFDNTSGSRDAPSPTPAPGATVTASITTNDEKFIALVPIYLKLKWMGSDPAMQAFIQKIEAGNTNKMLAAQGAYGAAITYLKSYIKDFGALDASRKSKIRALTSEVQDAESKLSSQTAAWDNHLLKRPNDNVSELAEDEDLIEINDPIINDYLDEQAKINGITDIDQLSRIAREAAIDGPLSLGVDYKTRIDRALTELLEDRGLSSSDFEQEKQEYITQFQLESFEKMEKLFNHLQGQVGNGKNFITLDKTWGPIMEFKGADGLVRKERTLATALKFLEAISKDPVGLWVVTHWWIEGWLTWLSARSPFTWLAIEGWESLNGWEVDGLSESFLALSAIYTLARSVYAPTDSIMKLPFTQRIQGNNSSARNRIKKINLTALGAATDPAIRDAEKTRLIDVHGQDDFDRAVLAKQRIAILDNLILEYKWEVPQNKTLIDKLKNFKKANVYFKNTGSFNDIRSNNIFYHDLYQLENQANILWKLKNLDLLTWTPEFIRTLTGRTFFRELSSGETSYELHYQVRLKRKWIKSIGRGIGMDETRMNDFHEKYKWESKADIDAVKSEFDSITKKAKWALILPYEGSMHLVLRNAINSAPTLESLKGVLEEVWKEIEAFEDLSKKTGYGNVFGEIFERGIFIKGDGALIDIKANIDIMTTTPAYKPLLSVIKLNPSKYMSLLESSAPEQWFDILIWSDASAQKELFDINGKYNPQFASIYGAKMNEIRAEELKLTKISATKDPIKHTAQEVEIARLKGEITIIVSDQVTLNSSDLAVAKKNTLDKLRADLSADPDGKIKFDILKHFILSDDTITPIMPAAWSAVPPHIRLVDINGIAWLSDSWVRLTFSGTLTTGSFAAALDDPARSTTTTWSGSGPSRAPSMFEKSGQAMRHLFFRLRGEDLTKNTQIGFDVDKKNIKIMAAQSMRYTTWAAIDWKVFDATLSEADLKIFVNAQPDLVTARMTYVNGMAARFPDASDILHRVPWAVIGSTEYNRLPNFMKILLKTL